MFSWQSKYRSADAKNELENTFNGIATDSDVAIYWFKMIKKTYSAVKMRYLGYANIMQRTKIRAKGQYLNFESLLF